MNGGDKHRREDIKIEILTKQLSLAIDLYTHEDKLNWSKVRHLLYITAGLSALLSFILKNRVDFVEAIGNPVCLVSLFGIMISLGFFVAILFGVIYMWNRKMEVFNIESLLMKYGGVSILGFKDSSYSNRYSYKTLSPTMVVLVAFPLGITIFWIFVLASAS